MEIFVGIDVGGTKTHTLAVDGQGRVLGFAADAASGTHRVGFARFREVLARSIAAVLEPSGATPADVTAAAFGVAGYDWPIDLPPTAEAVGALGLGGAIAIHNDGDLPLAAGCREGWGLAINAGTGSIVTGMGPDGEYARSTGGSTLLGELGGGKELVDLAIQAVSFAYIRRGPETRIRDALLRQAGETEVVTLLGRIARHELQISPDFSREIVALARDGDGVAIDLLRRSGEDLGWTAVGVIRQLGIQGRAFEVVLSGSMFRAGGAHLVAPLQAGIRSEAPEAVFTELETAPVLGGVILAMKRVGFDFRPLRARIISELNRLAAD